MEKLLPIFRFTLFLFLLISTSLTSAAYDFVYGNIYYNITSSTNMTAAVTYYSKTDNTYSGTVTIPEKVTHDGKTYYVTAIGESAFVGCTGLKKVNFSSQRLTSVGDYAFQGCNGMTSFVIPPQITSIGNGVFNGCLGMTGLTIEESEESLSLGDNGGTDGIFRNIPLTSVFIGRPLSYNTGSSYGYSPFAYNKTLVKAHFGNPVKNFPNYLFLGCTSLATMVYNSQFKPTSVGSNTFNGCTSLTWSALNLPQTVTSIGEYAFKGCTKFTSVVIKPNITSISEGAFNGCTEMTGLTIEESEESLSLGDNGGTDGIFRNIPLTSVFIGRPLSYNTGSSYGYSPFAYNKTLVKAHFGNPVKNFPNYLFLGCTSLATMVYNSQFKPTSVGSNTFNGCTSLTWSALNLPQTVTSIGEYAFKGCTKFTSVVIKPNITFISEGAFNGCTEMTGLTIEESEESLSLGDNGGTDGIFRNIPLTSVFIGRPLSYNTGSSYGYSPFAYNKTLVKAHFGNPVKNFPNYLFLGCTSLATMVYNSQFKPTSVGSNTFNGCTSLTWSALNLPQTVTSIGEYAFKGCTKFTSVVIKPNITFISEGAFNGCTEMTGLTIEESEESLSLGDNGGTDGIFRNIPLTSVFIGRPLSYNTGSSYGYSPFAYNKTLVKAHFGNPVKNFPNYLFLGCTSLATMVYNSQFKPTSVGSNTFNGCTSLTWSALNLPQTVTSIGEYAFKGCTKLTSVVIKPNITFISEGAFNGCTEMTGLTIEESEESLSLGDNGGTDGIFRNIPLTSVFIGRPLSYNTGSSYGYSPFAYNKTLVKARLGKKLTSLRNYLFYGCTYLVEVTSCAAVPPTANTNCFGNYDAKLYVPKNSVSTYRSANVWKDFSNITGVDVGDDEEPIVPGWLYGDMNGDGKVNISDVSALITYILTH